MSTKIKILIADDTKTVRFYERSLLSVRDYEIEEAVDGVDALERVKTFRPHLVLMDIMMPRMDGIECCRCIKADDEFKETKVIMVTTKDEYKKIDEAFKAGCDDYVIKPVDQAELLKKIDELSDFVRFLQKLRT